MVVVLVSCLLIFTFLGVVIVEFVCRCKPLFVVGAMGIIVGHVIFVQV